MDYLVDTNVLLRLVIEADPQHRLVRGALRALRRSGARLYFSPQNLLEFWNVCTRPSTARGGMGLSVAEADWAARIVERVCRLLPDDPLVHQEWRRLVVAHAVSGVQVYDARLAAIMAVNGITHLLTFNVSDFRRFPEDVRLQLMDVGD